MTSTFKAIALAALRASKPLRAVNEHGVYSWLAESILRGRLNLSLAGQVLMEAKRLRLASVGDTFAGWELGIDADFPDATWCDHCRSYHAHLLPCAT